MMYGLLIVLALFYGLASGVTRFVKKGLVAESIHVGLFFAVCAVSHAAKPSLGLFVWVIVAIVAGILLGRKAAEKPR